MSNNFKPNKKSFKRGKLKKPQSQKEPKLSYKREIAPPEQQIYGGSLIVDNPSYVPNQGLIPESYEEPTHSYNNVDRSTASSVGSGGYYNAYQQPGYHLYPGNYYPQAYGMHGGQQMVHPPTGGHYGEYIPPQNMGHMYHHNAPSLQTISSGGSLASETMSQGETNLMRSPVKNKRGFRKVKSTNEKSLPIDPNARDLILKCDKEPALADKLKILRGQIGLLVYNQSGSRFLQNLLKKANNDTIEFFLKEIENDLFQLMMDKYGNYCCQELLQSCSGTQRLIILEKIKDNFIQICKDKKGTHAIQKLVDLATLGEEEKYFEEALKGEVARLSVDQQGTHIIQKIIISFEEENRKFIFDEIIEGFMIVSKTSHGLCVIKKLIANTSTEDRPKLIDYCRLKVIELMLDPYGNYALQEIMDKWPEQHFLPLIEKDNNGLTCSINKIAQLSIQKFSSNVVEKCIKLGTKEERNEIILHISKIGKLVNLMYSSFGNYVVQTALELSEGDSLNALTGAIYKNIPDISDKKIRVKWAKLLFDRIHSYPDLLSTYNLEEYLSEGVQVAPVQKMKEDQMNPGYPAYPPPTSAYQSYHPAPPMQEPMMHPHQNQSFGMGQGTGMNGGQSTFQNFQDGGQNHFQVFGNYGMKPQFNDEDSD